MLAQAAADKPMQAHLGILVGQGERGSFFVKGCSLLNDQAVRRDMLGGKRQNAVERIRKTLLGLMRDAVHQIEIQVGKARFSRQSHRMDGIRGAMHAPEGGKLLIV